MKSRALVVAALLILASCSGETNPPGSDGSALSISDGEKSHSGKENGGRAGGKKEGQKDRQDGGGPETSDPAKSGSSERPGTDPKSGSEGSDGVALPLPASGSYSYVQSGWEELCQASNCDRSDLPPSQSVRISFDEKSARRAVFVSESEGSGSRSQAITYDVRPEGAFIDELDSTFKSGAFSFTAEIIPSPPVKAAIFPLKVGASWSGRWEDRNDQIDGSYSFSVVGRDQMSVDGETEDVLVMDMDMELTGDYRGTNEIRLWVIPERFTIAATKGFTEIESSYGTYRSRFATSYGSGP